MAVEKLMPQPGAPAASRSELRFPSYNLDESIKVPKAVHAQGGGSCSLEHLATYLNYKGTNNGAFVSKVGAARMFGLLQKSGNLFAPTQLGHQLLSPVYPHEVKQGLVEAFFNVPLFKRIYDDFKGRELPPEAGLKNAMRSQYGILDSRIDLAYRVLIDSAETAGLFATRGGARTHLIIPQIAGGVSKAHVQPEEQAQTSAFNGGSSTTMVLDVDPIMPGNPNRFMGVGGSAAMADVKARYLSTLIEVFESKSAKGEMDEKLMERIERLLGEQAGGSR